MYITDEYRAHSLAAGKLGPVIGFEGASIWWVSVPVPRVRRHWRDCVEVGAPDTKCKSEVLRHGSKIKHPPHPRSGKVQVVLIYDPGAIRTPSDAMGYALRNRLRLSNPYRVFDLLSHLGNFHRKVLWNMGRGPGIMPTEPTNLGVPGVDKSVGFWFDNSMSTAPRMSVVPFNVALGVQTIYVAEVPSE